MRIKTLLRGERGSVLVEFAMVFPILLLIIWGIVDFARAFYTLNSLSSAAREGARVAAVQAVPLADSGTIKSRVKTAFNAFGGDSIRNDQIFITDESIINGSVTVEVRNYQWNATTPLATLLFTNGQILMTRKATFRWEREPT